VVRISVETLKTLRIFIIFLSPYASTPQSRVRPPLPSIRDSIVGKATRLRAGGSRIQIPVEAIFFLFSKTSRASPVSTQSPIQWAPEYFPRVKGPGNNADHSSPSSPEVKDEWCYNSTPRIRLQGVDGENFTSFTVPSTPISLFINCQIFRRYRPTVRFTDSAVK
jgi:hypothetical protein